MVKRLGTYDNKAEESVIDFWKKNKISDKVRQQNEKSEKNFYFMDGPPYATGHIHMGTALNKILKDIAMRSKRMQGFNVFDRPGYDTHGLPIEHKVETELGISEKQEIEEMGVDKFVHKCREFATKHIDTMNSEFNDLGVWMDWSNPYLTLSNEYIEAIWWTFKKAHEKELLYLGKYPVHICPRCATAVAFNEIEYEKVKDKAIFVKFPLKNEENTFLIIWTTTPWTLPGNSGVMINPKFEYSFVKMSNGEKWVIASELVQSLMDSIEAGFTIEKTINGKDLIGKKYVNPLFDDLNLIEAKNEMLYTIVPSERYVNLDSGSGLVHCAPGHGKEDFEVGSKAKLPVICPIKIDGKMTEEAGKYEGMRAKKDADKNIVIDLEKKGMLVHSHSYQHDYPLCWRCKSPLLMFATPQWFFKIEGIKEKLIKENKTVNWSPKWMETRMDSWLQGISDWPVSRERYWGTPLPIWVCDKCGEQKVIGSIEELNTLTKLPKDFDLHKPFIDSVEFGCEKCDGKMKRVSEVLDVWFDAGVSSWAALGFPNKKENFEKFWPADLNIEGTDQFRGWWNSQIITSIISFDKKPFKAIMTHGMVLDLGKVKMSKSKGNIVSPSTVIEKYNRDYLRYYLAKTSKGEDIAFDWDSFKDISRFFNILWNTFNFVSMYLEIDFSKKLNENLPAEDKWILSRLEKLKKEVIESYNNYNFSSGVNAIEKFVMEDLSRTYIKLIRDRTSNDGETLSSTLSNILFSLLKLLAPVTPHVSEYIYRFFKNEKDVESIHFHLLPEFNEKLVNEKIEQEMNLASQVIQAALNLRIQESLRKRWPLNSVVVKTESGKEFSELGDVIAKSVNVKSFSELKKNPEGEFVSINLEELKLDVFLETKADDDLKNEWEFREIIRKIQSMRKQVNLEPKQRVKLLFDCSDKEFIEKFKEKIELETNTLIEINKGKMEKVLEREFFLELKP